MLRFNTISMFLLTSFAQTQFGHALSALNLVSDCDIKFARNLNFKSSCLINGDPQSCLNIALVGAAGGSIGVYAQESLNSVVKASADPDVSSLYQKTISQMQALNDHINRAESVLAEIRKKARNSIDPEIVRTAETPATSAPGSYAKMMNAKIQYEKLVNAKIIELTKEAALNENLPPQVREYLRIAKGTDDGFREFERRATEQGKAIINKNFPGAEEKIDGMKRRLKLDPNVTWQSDKLNKLVAKSDLKTKLYHLLNNQIGLHHGVSRKLSDLTQATQLDNKVQELANEETRSKNQVKNGSSKAATRGAVIGTMAGVLAGIAAEEEGVIDVHLCAENLGLSQEEVELLTRKGNGLLIGAKASKAHGLLDSCKTVFLYNPGETLAEAIEKFGAVPKGICEIAKRQDQTVEELLGSDSGNPRVSCSEYSDTNVVVKNDDETKPVLKNSRSKDILEFKYDQVIYKIPYRNLCRLEEDKTVAVEQRNNKCKSEVSYPDFRFAKAFDKNKKELRNTSLQLQAFYNQIHPPNIPEGRPDLTDLSFDCPASSNNDNVDAFCRIRSAAMRARVVTSTSKIVCDQPPEQTYRRNKPEQQGTR